MRIRPHLLLAFCLITSSGCMALDELDKASAKMKRAPGKTVNSAKAEPDIAAPDAPNPLVEQSKEWWSSATSLSTKNVNSSIVRCRLPAGTNFMSKDDCLGRGGSPEGV